MTCHEFASIRRDFARQQWLSDAARQQASQHLAGCTTCRDHLETERALTTALAALSRHREAISPPPAIEAALTAAFEQRNQSRRFAIWRKAAWAIPIAAGLLLFAFLRFQKPEPRLAHEERPRPSERIMDRAPEPEPEQSAPPQIAESKPRVRRAATTPRNNEYVTEFVPLRYGKPLESGEPVVVVRMELPAAQLRRLGLPVAPDAVTGAVKADVLLGGDGLAKAIRFVY